MGYYTRYKLDTIGGDTYRLQKELAEDIGYSPFEEECKWYEHEYDMKKFSKKYPEVVFILNGVGEENDDIWVAYYKNGKSHTETAQIVLAPYDETKLK